MSNLKLPGMSYANLMGIARKANGEWKKIAYCTHVAVSTSYNNVVLVKHHDTVIAELDGVNIRVTTGGWNSRTTANRIDALMSANCAYDYRAIFKNGEICVMAHGDRSKAQPLLSMGEIFVCDDSADAESVLVSRAASH